MATGSLTGLRRSRKRRHYRGRSRPDSAPWSALALTFGMLAVFGWMYFARDDQAFINQWGLVPSRFLPALAGLDPWFGAPDRWTPLTAILVHLDWLHLLGNLAFFWLFAQSIERRVGAIRFMMIATVSGVVGNLFQVWQTPELQAPLVGASGATAGLFAAFLVLYPRAKVGVILPLGLYLQPTRVPGVMLFGLWLVIQFGYILASEYFDATAWWTHTGGFACGLILTSVARILGVVRR